MEIMGQISLNKLGTFYTLIIDKKVFSMTLIPLTASQTGFVKFKIGTFRVQRLLGVGTRLSLLMNR